MTAQGIDLARVTKIFEASKAAAKAPSVAVIEPLAEEDVKRIDQVSDGEEMRWIHTGFKLIAEVCSHFQAIACFDHICLPHMQILS